MSAPFPPRRKRKFTPSVPLSVRHQQYEQLKSELTALAKTPAEYDAARRRAAEIAGV